MNQLQGLVDTHAHLSYLDERGMDSQTITMQLFDAGFSQIIDIGTNATDLPGRIKAFSHFNNVRYAAGIWPHREAISDRQNQIDLLRQNIESAPTGLVAAIGECGFDRRENPEASAGEIELFTMQMDLALHYKKPVIVHTREAAADAQNTLSAYKNKGITAIIHCFSYGAEDAKKFIDAGCYISFAGNITFKNAPLLHEAIKVVPLDRLLLETDCPFLAPVPFRGQSGQPAMIIETYKKTAELLSIDIETLKEAIRKNVKKVFGD
ncbi:MAG: YchF/TatD family DNA exonuclease [Termitinemataceae bacterium]|nr:MAG: YchF/TatD family DNA exonuclease [Termitinemataceae bacterium]